MGGRFGAVLSGALLAIAVLAPSAMALGNSPMQALLNSDGTARLFANEGGGSFSWEQCDVALTDCVPVGSGREINIADAPDETVFKLIGGTTGYSPVWHGNLEVESPPAVSGEIRAGELVTPVDATWKGGWEGDFDQTQLAACATSTGEGCTSITDPSYLGGCQNGSAYIDPSFAGDYLRVADMKLGPGTISTLIAFTSPYGHPIWPAQGNTAVAIVGQIAAPTHAWDPQCGPALLQEKPTPPPVEGSITPRGMARVHCATGCHAVLVARRGRRGVHKARTIGASGSSTTLTIPHSLLKRLGYGRTSFRLKVDGTTVAHAMVTLSQPRKTAKGSR